MSGPDLPASNTQSASHNQSGRAGRSDRRLSVRDRAWWPFDIVRAAGPLTGITAANLAEALIRTHRASPAARMVCRLDIARRRWVRIPPAEFADRIRDLVVEVDPGGQAPADAAAWRVVEEPLGDRPAFFAVCGPYVAVKVTHALGDGRIANHLFPELIKAAVAGRAAVEPFPAPSRLPLTRALLHHFSRHPGRLPDAVRVRRPPVVPPPVAATAVEWKPQLAHCFRRSTERTLDDLRAWRTANVPEVSLTTTVFAVVAAALDRVGYGTDRPGLVILVDGRRYLPAGHTAAGNFASGQYVVPDRLTDPRAIDRAMRTGLTSGRSLVMMALRDLHVRLAGDGAATTPPSTVRADARPELTLTHIGRLDAYTELPWAGPVGQRRALSVPTPSNPEAVTVSIAELFGALHVNTTFHSSTFDPATVARAVELVCTDPIELLTTANQPDAR